jgi:hypothetical protein
VWNRCTLVPAFSASTDPTTNITQITTARLAVRLVDRSVAPAADTLQITVLSKSFWANITTTRGTCWAPSTPWTRPRATLDQDGSLLDPLGDQDGTLPYYPCVMGLVSKSSWALVDESRRWSVS